MKKALILLASFLSLTAKAQLLGSANSEKMGLNVHLLESKVSLSNDANPAQSSPAMLTKLGVSAAAQAGQALQLDTNLDYGTGSGVRIFNLSLHGASDLRSRNTAKFRLGFGFNFLDLVADNKSYDFQRLAGAQLLFQVIGNRVSGFYEVGPVMNSSTNSFTNIMHHLMASFRINSNPKTQILLTAELIYLDFRSSITGNTTKLLQAGGGLSFAFF